MVYFVQKKIKDAHTDYYGAKVNRKDWVLAHVGQAIASVAQMTWTESCEMAINDMEV
jgi:hydrogenase maturation factor